MKYTVILHPNTEYLGVTCHGKKFNNERYTFTRKSEPEAEEQALHDALNEIVGLRLEGSGGNELRLELSDGMDASEVINQLVAALSSWCPVTELVILDRRAKELWSDYDEEGYGYGQKQVLTYPPLNCTTPHTYHRKS